MRQAKLLVATVLLTITMAAGAEAATQTQLGALKEMVEDAVRIDEDGWLGKHLAEEVQTRPMQRAKMIEIARKTRFFGHPSTRDLELADTMGVREELFPTNPFRDVVGKLIPWGDYRSMLLGNLRVTGDMPIVGALYPRFTAISFVGVYVRDPSEVEGLKKDQWRAMKASGVEVGGQRADYRALKLAVTGSR